MWVYSSTARVERVIDGDTFVIETGERVRMIGIDAPEVSDILGPHSTQRLKELIERKHVQLVTDGISSDRDRYGRLLRYVELDGEDINLRMVQEGQAVSSP
jgi:micrococcal nuclease